MTNDHSIGELAGLRALLDAATAQPWHASAHTTVYDANSGPIVIPPIRHPQERENVALIVAAVNALPGLLDRLELAGSVCEAADAALTMFWGLNDRDDDHNARTWPPHPDVTRAMRNLRLRIELYRAATTAPDAAGAGEGE